MRSVFTYAPVRGFEPAYAQNPCIGMASVYGYAHTHEYAYSCIRVIAEVYVLRTWIRVWEYTCAYMETCISEQVTAPRASRPWGVFGACLGLGCTLRPGMRSDRTHRHRKRTRNRPRYTQSPKAGQLLQPLWHPSPPNTHNTTVEHLTQEEDTFAMCKSHWTNG